MLGTLKAMLSQNFTRSSDPELPVILQVCRSCLYYVPGGPEERADNLGSRGSGLELKVLIYI